MARNRNFAFKQFKIEQGQCAMKVTTDACIFGALFGQSPNLKESQSILDIGAGTGLLSLMAAQNSQASISAIELDEEASKQAEDNFTQSPWADQLQLINSSIQAFSATSEQRFDGIISNPPFFQQAFKGNDHRRNLARHTDSLSFSDLAKAIGKHLANSGEAWILLPVESSHLFLAAAIQAGLILIKKIGLRSSSSHNNHRYILVLKHLNDTEEPQINQETTVTIYDQHPHYTEEVRGLMSPYYLAL